MKILSVKASGNSTAFEVKLSEKEFADAYAKSRKELGKNIQIPGFRKGHVPANIIDERVSPADICVRTLNNRNYMGKVIKEIVDSKEFGDTDCLDQLARGSEIVKFDINDSPVVKFYFENMPEVSGFEAKDVKNLEIPPMDIKPIDDNFVKAQIRGLIQRDAMVSDKKDQVVAKGNIAVINFKGFVDGKAFKGGEGKNYQLEIGSKSFIDNFEDQLIGCKKGDKKDVNVKFPADYHVENLKGKPAKFEVEILGVKEVEYPEITKEYLKKYNIDASNEKELGDYVRRIYKESNEEQYTQTCMRIINEKISKVAKVNYYPESLLNQHRYSIVQQYTQEAQQRGFKTLEAYKKALAIEDGKFNEFVDQAARTSLSVALVYEKLIEQLEIKVEDADKKDYVSKLVRFFKNGKAANSYYESNKDQCESIILRNKLFKRIITDAKKVKPEQKVELKEDKKAK